MSLPKRLLLLILLLFPLHSFTSLPVHAQELDPETARDLRQLEDSTRPIAFRAQLAGRLIAEGKPAALDGIRRILRDQATDSELRLSIVGHAVAQPALSLYQDVMEALVPEAGTDLLTDSKEFFKEYATAPLLGKFGATANSEAAPEAERLLAIDLLGATRAKGAVEPLLRMWESLPTPYSEAAQRALQSMIPRLFHDVGEARKFWEANRALPMDEIVLKAARSGGNGGADPGGVHRLELLSHLVKVVPLANVLDLYVACLDDAEIRALGAKRLKTYPYADREGDAGRALAAAAVVAALRAEEDAAATVLFLDALGPLAGALPEDSREPAFNQVASRLGHVRKEVRRAAVIALGDLGDPRALDPITALYDRLGAGDPEIRLQILDSIEKVGDGISGWVHDKLKAGDTEERIILRLIQLVKGYPGERAFIPTLGGLLKDGQSPVRVRREAASTLGIVGVQAGDEEAIDALALFGLVDVDESVRVIAATQLGRAPEDVSQKVIEMLRQRVSEAETQDRVRKAAARSLLRLRQADAIAQLNGRLNDDAFWNEVVLNFLKADLIGAKDAVEAARFVRALRKAGFFKRCVEAGELVLDAQDLPWEGDAEASRGEAAFDLAASLGAVDRAAEGLKVLDEQVPEGPRRTVLRGILLRQSGAPAEALVALDGLLGISEGVPLDVLSLGLLERAHCLLDLGRFDEAIEALTSLVDDSEVGKSAKYLLEEARKKKGEAPAPAEDPALLVKLLDAVETRPEAVAKLQALGKTAHEALLAWLGGKEPAAIPAALAAITEITGVTVPYDPAAPAPEGKTVVDRLREALAPSTD